MPMIMTATMATYRLNCGISTPPKSSLSGKPRSTSEDGHEEGDRKGPFQRRASPRDVTALHNVLESFGLPHLDDIYLSADDASLDDDDDDSTLGEISLHSSFGINFYMRSILSEYELEAEDCIVVDDNVRVHKSKTTPFIPHESFASMQFLSRNNNPIYSLDRIKSDDDEADDDSRDKEGDLQALTTRFKSTHLPPLPKWDSSKDSVVGVGNVKKNRWGNSNSAHELGKAPNAPPIVPLANSTGVRPRPLNRDTRISMPSRRKSFDWMSPASQLAIDLLSNNP
jgi:hypothetical protein